MACEDTVLPAPLTNNHIVIGITYGENAREQFNENVCLFGALALRLHGNG